MDRNESASKAASSPGGCPPGSNLRGYDWRKSYAWNYQHVPEPPVSPEPPGVPGTWDFCGLPVGSPLGIPAGPLLNSRWIRYYAALGFDVLTYKTVRSSARSSHPLPNLLPIESALLDEEPGTCQAAGEDAPFDSWAISFGMPSQAPEVWRQDIRLARQGLRAGQLLVVSVVATPGEEPTTSGIVADYAQCARWAVESGADAVEANLSCPNVTSVEGDLYLRPDMAGDIARAIRSAVGNVPLILKVGLFPSESLRAAFCDAVGEHTSAISTTNTVRARVVAGAGRRTSWFRGEARGIGGAAVSPRCLAELLRWKQLLDTRGSSMRLISVGGVSTVEDVLRRLTAGAHHVQLATAVMRDPAVAWRMREQWPREASWK